MGIINWLTALLLINVCSTRRLLLITNSNHLPIFCPFLVVLSFRLINDRCLSHSFCELICFYPIASCFLFFFSKPKIHLNLAQLFSKILNDFLISRVFVVVFLPLTLSLTYDSHLGSQISAVC